MYCELLLLLKTKMYMRIQSEDMLLHVGMWHIVHVYWSMDNIVHVLSPAQYACMMHIVSLHDDICACMMAY